jgi:hypothetical protein
MNQRFFARNAKRLRDENARRNELRRQAELLQEHPEWPAERIRDEARKAGSTHDELAPGTTKPRRKRDRRNKHGRRGPSNRCGHDRNHFHRPTIARNLPPFIYTAIAAFEECCRSGRLPSSLNFHFRTKSERDEAVYALVLTMIANTCVLSQRIGRPSRRKPGFFEGLTIDYHLAPSSGTSESRLERAIATLKDWAWLHFEVGKNGRRQCAQAVELTEAGYRGDAAVRCWAPDFWRDIGISLKALKDAQRLHAEHLARKKASQGQIPVAPTVEKLVDALWSPESRPRPPP